MSYNQCALTPSGPLISPKNRQVFLVVILLTNNKQEKSTVEPRYNENLSLWATVVTYWNSLEIKVLDSKNWAEIGSFGHCFWLWFIIICLKDSQQGQFKEYYWFFYNKCIWPKIGLFLDFLQLFKIISFVNLTCRSSQKFFVNWPSFLPRVEKYDNLTFKSHLK